MNATELRKIVLFKGMTDGEITAAISRLSAGERSYRRGATILHAGNTTQLMGLVLNGSVNIENNDMWGNRTILSNVEEGQFFAETYAMLANEPMLVDAVANEDCRILLLRIGGLHRLLQSAESWTMKLITNLLTISTHKNLLLSGRSFHTAPKTIRGRVMSYLNSVSLKAQSREFDIPFDRQQLADYLNVERSALSKELGKMQRDGLINVRKNHFLLMSEQDAAD